VPLCGVPHKGTKLPIRGVPRRLTLLRWNQRIVLLANNGRASEMNSSQALQLLAESKATLAERFHVAMLGLFGSFAGNAARDDSDVDIIIGFDGPATSGRYFGAQYHVACQLYFAIFDAQRSGTGYGTVPSVATPNMPNLRSRSMSG
jgi:predicted nucleotidyltransferase